MANNVNVERRPTHKVHTSSNESNIIRNELTYIGEALKDGKGLHDISKYLGIGLMPLYTGLTEVGALERINIPDSLIHFYLLQHKYIHRRYFLRYMNIDRGEFVKLERLVKAPKNDISVTRDKYILSHYRSMSVRTIANNLLIHSNTVISILRENGVDIYGGDWSSEELKFLRNNHRIMKLRDLAVMLRRENYQVLNTIERRYKVSRHWRREELEYVRNFYYVHGAAPLALKFGVSVNCITQAYHKLY